MLAMASISEAFAIAVRHHEVGQLEAAEQIYRQILVADPNNAAACYNLANALQVQGKLSEAVESYQRTLAITPQHAEAHSNLGAAFQALGKLDEAIACYRRALELGPNSAIAIYNLGAALQDRGQVDDAIAQLRRAILLKPDLAEAHNRLGNAHQDQGNLAFAGDCYHQALHYRPNYAEAISNLGNVLQSQGNSDAAVACFRRALELKPDLVEAHNSLGTMLYAEGNLDEASACYRAALMINPAYAEAQYNQSMLLLQQGDFERGWRQYEWRWRCKEFKAWALQGRLWDGSPMPGSLLLHADQGLGDALQFVRYAPMVKRCVGRVVLRCKGSLIPLLRRCQGIDELVPHEALAPDFDAQAHLMSLPLLLHTTLGSIPNEVPYLVADPELVEQWRARLPKDGFKVGIAWQGNPVFKFDKSRSIPFAEFAPLEKVPDVKLISLQKGFGSEQIDAIDTPFDVIRLSPEFDESVGAFMDTAAIMMNLDLVITSDTSIAHLAGGLGVPVWVALSSVPEWRWLLNRTDSPWYPTMRLFRQSRAGDWRGVFEQMQAELTNRMASRHRSTSLDHDNSP